MNEQPVVITGRTGVPGRADWLRIELSNGEALEVPLASWLDRGLRLGQAVTPDLLQALAEDAAEAKAYQQALAYLQRRDRTAQEVRRFLQRKNVPAPVAASVLQRLQAAGWVDDARFVLRFWEMHREQMSRQEMRWRLRQRGAASSLIDTVLAGNAPGAADGETRGSDVENSERSAALRLAEKYWRTHASLPWLRRRERLSAWLYRRGFPAAVVQDAVRAVAVPEAGEECGPKP
ncbi:hypothetical protein GCM10010885_12130 [Alicyclobacillus cellulosilyticus]|uniref:Regulatory protein RecX n=1 Tax=Alicyclobacillus cellulosilyticus TaxID=1003997 RepID=A0A917K8E7_9BACL|nr:RecX family transcriptional regulator [Alicyclobacillus cellulosilyticus]GGJ04508.1 hypothetical protein GCM10010885_12130 [Alicyclobacillus cellulosilyticus]